MSGIHLINALPDFSFMRLKKEDYSVEEIRAALLKRAQHARLERLEEFGRTGKIKPQLSSSSFQHSVENGSERKVQGDRSWLGSLLKVLEIGSVISLVILGLTGWNMLGEFNQETRKAMQLPAAAPTPLVTPVDLPSGHRDSNTSVLVYQQFPKVHGLESETGRYVPLQVDQGDPEFPTRIIIPSIEVDAPIVFGAGSEQLKKGVGQVPGSANPGQSGNLVLTAHNDIYGEIFRYLDQLGPGDQFTVYTNLRAYTYSITNWFLVEPTQVEVMAPTLDATATLISCYPYLVDTMRIIVKARLLDS